MQRISKANRGFSLVEILVVFAVMGVLAAIIIPSITRSRAEAKLTTCKENLQNIATAEGVYFTTNNCYASIDDLVAGEYMKEAPTCPSSGETYTLTPKTVDGLGIVAFTVSCTGTAHSACGVPEGYPMYSQQYAKVMEQPE